MSIDRGIPGCPCQIFVVFVSYVSPIKRVLLSQPKIDDEYSVALFVLSDQKIVRFDVPMNKTLRVDILDPIEHLQSDHDDRLQWKTLSVLFEQGF